LINLQNKHVLPLALSNFEVNSFSVKYFCVVSDSAFIHMMLVKTL